MANSRPRTLTAFVRVSGDAGDLFEKYDCRSLAQWDDIHIVSIPLPQLENLSTSPRVLRIEAGQSCHLQLDTTAIIHRADEVYAGKELPQGYTGKGVIVGVQDVGFDISHPTFLDSEGKTTRIRRFWDQISAETEGSTMPVGQEFTTADEILRVAHSRDAETQWHGTHTTGIAAGNGAGTLYRGIAFESGICLVSNTVLSDTIYVDKEDREKYTSAMDALGFKYIFDYADEVGKPCVISFSEGFTDYFSDETQLFYEVINRLVGEGRIMVISAGNKSTNNTYFMKPRGESFAGTFLKDDGSSSGAVGINMLSADPFTLKLFIFDGSERHEFSRSSAEILSDADSLIIDEVKVGEKVYDVFWNAYTPTGDFGEKIVFQLIVAGEGVGIDQALAVSVEGREATVECFESVGTFTTNSLIPALCSGEPTHNILVPGSSPDAICVGATSHRVWFERDDGSYCNANWGDQGLLAGYSSVGPTPQGLIKPDVVANGTIVSSSSSYYYENRGRRWSDVAVMNYNGRTYPWHEDCGTSMSAPLVAGVVALWLQADPGLTPQKVKEIIANTSRHPDDRLEYPNNQYGYGEIDAAAGIRYLIQTSVQEVHQEPKGSSTTYNLQGMPVNDSYRGIVIRDGRKYHQK